MNDDQTLSSPLMSADPQAVPDTPLESSEADEKSAAQQAQGFGPAMRRAVREPYFYANLLYLVYVSLITNIDVNESSFEIERINRQYLAANVLHLINALMYIGVWYNEGFPLLTPLNIPECFNVIEACLYIASSTYYPQQQDEFVWVPFNASLVNSTEGDYVFVADPTTTLTENLEICAAVFSVMACTGWVFSWLYTYRRIPGRGFTLDDPDVWALATIFTGAVMYLVYYVNIIMDRSLYGTYDLYIAADWVYFTNAILYFICALRDVGFFWFMPTSGRTSIEKHIKQVKVE